MATSPTIAILGPGLLGGSVALAAVAFKCAERIHLWARREAAVEQIRALGIADLASTDLAEVVAGAQIIVLATPVGVMPELTKQLLALPLAPGTLITDLASVKGGVVRAIDALLAGHNGLCFVGSHPMAGKEHAGIEHATADLFQGAACVITPGATTTAAALQTVEEFWRSLGCVTTQMRPEQHDAAVARISHLPHLAASLVTTTALGNDASIGSIAGSGMRDTTRVASGSPVMWAEILLENRAAIIPALRGLSDNISTSLALLEDGDQGKLEAFLQDAKDLRDGLPDTAGSEHGD
jgi:prephenate dehydrogenase